MECLSDSCFWKLKSTEINNYLDKCAPEATLFHQNFQQSEHHLHRNYYYYFASAAVAVDSSHMTTPSSALWSKFSPPTNFANGHVSTMWFMVCHWPQSQEGDWVRPHLCKLVQHGP